MENQIKFQHSFVKIECLNNQLQSHQIQEHIF